MSSPHGSAGLRTVRSQFSTTSGPPSALLRGESGFYDPSLLVSVAASSSCTHYHFQSNNATPRRKEASFVRHREELIMNRLRAYREDLAEWFSGEHNFHCLTVIPMCGGR